MGRRGRVTIEEYEDGKRNAPALRRMVIMFEDQYNDEMEAEVKRLEAQQRAIAAGHPEWLNACAACGCELARVDIVRCDRCVAAG